MKFAVRSKLLKGKMPKLLDVPTISSRVHNDETTVDVGFMAIILEGGSVCMSSKALTGLVQMDLMICALQSPYCTEARAAAADDCYLLPMPHRYKQGLWESKRQDQENENENDQASVSSARADGIDDVMTRIS